MRVILAALLLAALGARAEETTKPAPAPVDRTEIQARSALIDVGRGAEPTGVGGLDDVVLGVELDDPADQRGVELAAEGGQDDWRRLAGTVSWGDGRFDVLATAFDREGDAGTTNSDFSTTQLLVNAGWSWADGGRVAVLAQDVDAEAGLAGLATLTHTPSPMGFLSEILGMPRNCKPYLLIPVGYPAEGTRVPDITKKPLEEILVRR